MASDADVKGWIASNHVPTRGELDALVAKFFVRGDAAAVSRLDQTLRGVVADKSALAQHQQMYRGNLRDGHGLSWYEQFGRRDELPSPVELALWLGSSWSDFPAPRAFCPPQLVGKWADGKSAWTFGADGAFASTEPAVAKQSAWCVHFVEGNADLRREFLWLYGGERRPTSTKRLIIAAAKENALELIQTGGSFADVTYQLTRSR